jgi:hypothetical protein
VTPHSPVGVDRRLSGTYVSIFIFEAAKLCFFNSYGGVKLNPAGMSATIWPTIPALDDMITNVHGAVGGMKTGRGNRSTRRKRASVPFWSLQTPHDFYLGSNLDCCNGKTCN